MVTPLLVPLDVPVGSANRERSLETLPDTYFSNYMLHGATEDFVRRGNPFDNKSELIGTWRSESDDRILTITFHHRLTCLYRIELKPGASDPRLQSFGGVCFGAGRWHVHRGFLNAGSRTQIDGRFGEYPEWSSVYEPDLPRSKIVEVNRDQFRLADGKVFKPRQQNRFKFFWLDCVQDRVETIVRWNAMSHIQKLGKPVLLRVGESCNCNKVIRSCDNSTNHHEQYVDQRINGFSWTRVGYVAKLINQ
mgnify:CR=1 FL=1